MLVVEDDDVIRATICEVLGEEGATVAAVGGVKAARAVLRSQPVSLVLLDFVLGDETAAPLLEELAVTREPPAVVMISAARAGPVAARTYDVPFVPKPFDIDHLLAVARAAVAQYRRPRVRPAQ